MPLSILMRNFCIFLYIRVLILSEKPVRKQKLEISEAEKNYKPRMNLRSENTIGPIFLTGSKTFTLSVMSFISIISKSCWRIGED